jgi:O-antigen/teichoic acid export membrane protein
MVSSFSRGIIYSFDLLVIGIFLGPRFAGYYSVGSKPVQFIATAIGLFYISFIASYSAAAPDEAATLFRRATRMTLVTTLPVTLVASFAAPFAIPFVFGDAYRHSVGILVLLAWKIPLSALSASYNGVLLAEGHQVTLMRNNVIAAVLNATGDLITIPLVGIYGAVVVNLFAASLVLVLNYRSAIARGIGLPLREIVRRTSVDADRVAADRL